MRKRVLVSLAVSVVISVLLFSLQRATDCKILFVLESPGFFAHVFVWGIHSGPKHPLVGLLLFGGVNALAYWPVVFGLSFLVRRNNSKPAHVC
jgi:hypothetical protein